MELLKAKQICKDIAVEAKRWGRHAGFAGYHEDDVRHALIKVDSSGLFDLEGEKEARVSANKNAGAAKARAARAQKKVERLEKITKDQQEVIDLLKKRIAKLEA
jgi:DNA-binding transcriptional regulator PaaX